MLSVEELGLWGCNQRFRVAAWSCRENAGLGVSLSLCPVRASVSPLRRAPRAGARAPPHAPPVHSHLPAVGPVLSPPSRCSSESQRVRNWNVAATSPEGSGVMTSSSRRLSRGVSAWPLPPSPESSRTSRTSTARRTAAAMPAAAPAPQRRPPPRKAGLQWEERTRNDFRCHPGNRGAGGRRQEQVL